MINITETDTELVVTFPYSDWMVRSLKQAIPFDTRKYLPGKKEWRIRSSQKRALLSWAAPYAHLVNVDKEPPPQIGVVEALPELTVEPAIRNDVHEMFPYQGRGVAYQLEHPQSICGDEPGLGKTVQAIAAMETRGCKCILIICPATLKENWKYEIEKIWTRKKALILTDRCKKTWHTFHHHGMVNYFICNFESLKKLFVEKIEVPEGETLMVKHIRFNERIKLFDGVIVDEIHRCKDGNTQQAKFVMGLTAGKPNVSGLSGTSVVNNAKDLVSQLYIINQLHVFGGYKNFIKRYCGKKKNPALMKELNYLMHKHCFYRRLKRDVLKDLPDKMRNVVRCEISTRAEYDKAENHLVAYLRENLGKTNAEINKSMRGEVMVMMTLLKKISARGKLENIIEHTKQITEAGEKIVLFAWHKEIVQAIKKAFPGSLTITGDDSIDDRNTAVHRFQNDPKYQVIICNIKAGGVGLTLTASSRVGFAELPWHPADCDQCEDRCHRIGQKDSVEATYFLGHQTIDEDIYKIINAKRKIVKDIIGTEDIETNIIDEFINLFRQKF